MKNRIVDNLYFLSILKKANTVIFGLIATVFLNRSLGPEIKGEYATVLNIVTLASNVLFLGISTVYPNYIRKNENWTKSTFWAIVYAQGLLYCLLSFVVFLFTNSFDYLLYALCISVSVVSIQVLQMSIVDDFRKGTIANIISVVTNAILLFLMWLLRLGSVRLAITILIIKELTIVLFSFSISSRFFKFSKVATVKWIEIIRVSFVPMITNLLLVLNYRIDVIILNYLCVEKYQIGLYATALALAEYAWIVIDVFKDVLIKKTSDSDNIIAVQKCMRLSSTALLIIGMFFLFFSKYILFLMYGAEYSNAWLVTDIVYIGVFAMSYAKLLVPLYLANGKWKFYFFVFAGAVLINVVANLIFIPHFGIYGAAITTILSLSFAGGAFTIQFIRDYNINPKDILFIKREDIDSLKKLFP